MLDRLQALETKVDVVEAETGEVYSTSPNILDDQRIGPLAWEERRASEALGKAQNKLVAELNPFFAGAD